MSGKKRRTLWLLLGVATPPLILITVVWWWGNIQREQNRQFNSVIAESSQKYKLDPLLIRAVIWRESDFDPLAYGLAEERGLMQVTPIAAGEWARAEGVENFRNIDLFDPRTGIQAGSWYLSRAISRWQHTDRAVVFALAEYNAGRTHARRWAEGLSEPKAALFIEKSIFPPPKNTFSIFWSVTITTKRIPIPPSGRWLGRKPAASGGAGWKNVNSARPRKRLPLRKTLI
ncbi:MAG: lytic transglycosylase domain-containing protein [Blastochloris sp.]|nr:lytic transglycosylase domain-containing protein [Blastochloris sp.]